MVYFIAVYIMFWIILSERVTIEGFIVGGILCALVMIFNKDVTMKRKKSNVSYFKRISLWVCYLFVLLKEIVLSNIQVAKIVLSPEIKISPRVVSFETQIKSNLNKTILANSITLTPGTITLGMRDGNMTIHCLEERYAEGVSNTEFEKIIKDLEE